MPKKAEVINIKPTEAEQGKKKRLELDSGRQILIQSDGKEERLEILGAERVLPLAGTRDEQVVLGIEPA